MAEVRARSPAWKRWALALVLLIVAGVVLRRGCSRAPLELRSDHNVDVAPLDANEIVDTPRDIELTATEARVAAEAPAGMAAEAFVVDSYFVRVADESGRVITNARFALDVKSKVVVGVAAANGEELVELQLTRSAADADSITALVDTRDRFRVSADGFVDALVRYEAGHSAAATPHVVVLTRPAALVVTVVDDDARPAQGVDVHLSWSELDLVRGGNLFEGRKGDSLHVGKAHNKPGTLQIGDLGGIERTQRTNANGTCVFEDLPPRIDLQVYAYRDKQYVDSYAGRLLLGAGERAEVKLVEHARVPVTLRFLRARDEPVVGERVVLVRARSSRPTQTFTSSMDFDAGRTTDADGRATFETLQARAYFAGLRPVSASETEKGASTAGTRIEITRADAGKTIEVLLPEALHVTGRVVDHAGNPVSSATVFARSESGAGLVTASSDANGEFRVGPLEPGACKLQAHSPLSSRRSAWTSTKAGSEHVELRLEPSGRVVLRLVPASGGVCGPANVRLVSNEGITFITRFADCERGAIAFDDPASESLAIVVTCANGDVGAVSTAARDFDWTQTISVVTRPAGDVSVRNTSDAERRVALRGTDGVLLGRLVLAAGATESARVPAGSLVVAVDARDIHVEVAAGALTAIDVP